MQKFFFLLLSILISFSYSEAQSNFNLQIKVKGIDKVKGNIRVCILKSKKDFPENCWRAKVIKVEERKMTILFDDIPKGEYAISIFHDENKDAKLNKNFFGIPTEDYGFSNNPKIRFGPPDFKECAFKVYSDKVITIDL